MKLQLEQIRALHVGARDGAAAALDALSLQVAPGEQVAIVGPSGAGKTTLLHAAAAALKPSQGHVLMDGVDPWTLGAGALRRTRGQLFLAPQTPPLPPRQRVVTAVIAGRLPAMSLWTSLRNLVFPQDIAAAHAALAHFEIEDKIFDRVDRLSGGERQRVGLARALVSPATLWLIDEPLSALDPARARRAIDALVSVAAERRVTLVATLHQVDVALERFARIVGLQAGRLAFDLPAREVTPQRLADLYGDEYQRLSEPASTQADGNALADEALIDATVARPATMHCR